MAVVYGIAKTTSTIILEALKVIERVLEIRKKAEEIKNLKLNNTKVDNELKKEAEEAKGKGIKKIIETLIKKLKIPSTGDGDKVVALEKSIRNLVDFVEKGGEVDFVVQDEKDQDGTDLINLRNDFEEIRKLENKLRQIEHKNS